MPLALFFADVRARGWTPTTTWQVDYGVEVVDTNGNRSGSTSIITDFPRSPLGPGTDRPASSWGAVRRDTIPFDAHGVAPISAPSSGSRTVNVVAPGSEVTFR